MAVECEIVVRSFHKLCRPEQETGALQYYDSFSSILAELSLAIMTIAIQSSWHDVSKKLRTEVTAYERLNSEKFLQWYDNCVFGGGGFEFDSMAKKQ